MFKPTPTQQLITERSKSVVHLLKFLLLLAIKFGFG